jgi:hypothetical protein
MGQGSGSATEHLKLTMTRLHGEHAPHACEQSGRLDPVARTSSRSSRSLLLSPPPCVAGMVISAVVAPMAPCSSFVSPAVRSDQIRSVKKVGGHGQQHHTGQGSDPRRAVRGGTYQDLV